VGLEGIRHFRQIHERLATAGQPTEEELALIAHCGYRAVINLALPSSTHALADEGGVLARLGVDYVPIPMHFESPELSSALRFFEELGRRQDERVFVHCAMNKRVSALVYVYRVAIAGEDPTRARADLDAIWTPSEAWRRLMSDAARRSLPAAIRLETPRLVLREFEEDDLDACAAYASDPEVVRFMVWGPNTREQTRDFLARQTNRLVGPDSFGARRSADDRSSFELAIVLREENALVGGIGLRVRNSVSREGDIGYVLNRRYWKRGIVTEAARRMLDFGFGVLGLHRIVATADTRNVGSLRVMEKIGMRAEGVFRQHQYLRGEWRDTATRAILEDE
jgi:RimJ/RimL family protein N-acetyltransferase/protein tyrosine phosphatase (PTP) superfamily phosphohydrolase (DUF442 family)